MWAGLTHKAQGHTLCNVPHKKIKVINYNYAHIIYLAVIWLKCEDLVCTCVLKGERGTVVTDRKIRSNYSKSIFSEINSTCETKVTLTTHIFRTAGILSKVGHQLLSVLALRGEDFTQGLVTNYIGRQGGISMRIQH